MQSHLDQRFRKPVARLGTVLLLSATPALAQGTLVADLNTTPPTAKFDGKVQVRGTALDSLWLSASRAGFDSPVLASQLPRRRSPAVPPAVRRHPAR